MNLASTTHPGNPHRQLLLVHGYTGSQDDFSHVLEPLTAHATVTTVDLPGHGLSSRADVYSYDVAADALASLLDIITPEPLDVLGHSMGGRIVLELAVTKPEYFRSLILMGTWADHPDRGEHAEALRNAFSLRGNAVIDALASIDRDTGERALIAARWGDDWVRRHDTHNDAYVDHAAIVDYGRQVFVGAASVLGDAANLDLPATVIVGGCDDPMLGSSRRLADALPQAELVVIDDAYHSPQLTHPVEWCEAIEKHLARS